MSRYCIVLLICAAACRRPEPSQPDPLDPASGCIKPRPVPAACKRSSDCYRDDLCAEYDCVSDRCVYVPRKGEDEPVTCDPGRPDGGRWLCRSPDPGAPGGYCCPVPVVRVVTP